MRHGELTLHGLQRQWNLKACFTVPAFGGVPISASWVAAEVRYLIPSPSGLPGVTSTIIEVLRKENSRNPLESTATRGSMCRTDET